MELLETSRLTLRPCTPADLADFIALEQDPEVMRFLNGGHPVDREKTGPDAGFLMPTGSESHVWTARRKPDGEFVGWFCLWPETMASAEIGYRLRRGAWGLGLASEGAAALIEWGFSDRGYQRVLATTMAVNRASRRVMEKLGMRYLRTEQPEWPTLIPGSEEGDVWYVLDRSDWRGHPP